MTPWNTLRWHRCIRVLIWLSYDLLSLGGELVGRVWRLDPAVVVLEVLLWNTALDSLIGLIRNVRALLTWIAVNVFRRTPAFDPVFGLLHVADFLVNRLAHCVTLILHFLAF